MTRENHVRVLLDSVSFSRTIRQMLASRGVLRADSSVSILRFTLFVNPFFELFSAKLKTFCAVLPFLRANVAEM